MHGAAIRSLLFVPGDSTRKIEKAFGSAADALILDLEDAVAPDAKPLARQITQEALRTASGVAKPIFVRINALDTDQALPDLSAVIAGAPFGIMLPKCAGIEDIHLLGNYLTALEAHEGLPLGSTRILPVATESATAVLKLGTYTGPRSVRLWGLLWGGEDLSADLGALRNRDATGVYALPYLIARAHCLMAATAASAIAVDAVFTDFQDGETLRRETEEAARDGFSAKAAIHPAQAAIINAAMTPSTDQIAWAKAVTAALEKTGVARLDGKMIDIAHLRAAKRILARARHAN